jgi:ATP-binding cassette subfamily B multidrug efflux pump
MSDVPIFSQKYFFLSLIKNLIKKYYKGISIGVFSLIMVDILEMIPSIAIKSYLDSAMTLEKTALYQAAGAILGAYLIMALGRFSWRYFIALNSRKIEAELRSYFMSAITNTSYANAKKIDTGDAYSRLNQDIASLQQFFGPGIIILFDIATYLVVIPLTLSYLLGPIILWILAPYLTLTVYFAYIMSAMDKQASLISDHYSDISEQIIEESQYQKFFRIFNLQKFRDKMYQKKIGTLFHDQVTLASYDVKLELVIELMVLLSYCVFFYLCLSSKILLTAATMVVTIQLLERMIWPMMGISYLVSIFVKGRTSANKIKAYFLLPPDQNEREEKSISFESFEIKNLILPIPPQPEGLVIHVDHFKFKRGEKIGILGKIGSGKSLFLQWLAGLYPHLTHASQLVFLNGQPIANHSIPLPQTLLSYLPQNAQIFNRNMRENLALDQPIVDAEILKAMHLADLSVDFADQETQIDRMLIGEKGLTLSGGQKQRVGIARSWYSKSQILLWDDTVSALDEETEKNIIDNIFKHNPDTVLILATHRENSLEKFDRKYLFEQGKLRVLDEK